jgi:Rod binding domain-containing protein
MQTGMNGVLQANASGGNEIQKKRLRESCREFESVMVSYVMKTMRDGAIKAEDSDNAMSMYEEMLDGQISKTVSNRGSLGMGDMLYSRLEPLIKTKSSKGAADNQACSTVPVDSPQPDTAATNTLSSVIEAAKLPTIKTLLKD